MTLHDDFDRILKDSFVIRVSHVGRRSGLPRILETTYYWDRDGGGIYLSGYPGKRDWVANMAVHPEVTVYTVQGTPWLEAPARAQVVVGRDQRMTRILPYVSRWGRRGGGGLMVRWALRAVRLNRALRLPWWGPFYCMRRVFDAMPCIEITLTGSPTVRNAPPPEPTLPRQAGRR